MIFGVLTVGDMYDFLGTCILFTGLCAFLTLYRSVLARKFLAGILLQVPRWLVVVVGAKSKYWVPPYLTQRLTGKTMADAWVIFNIAVLLPQFSVTLFCFPQQQRAAARAPNHPHCINSICKSCKRGCKYNCAVGQTCRFCRPSEDR